MLHGLSVFGDQAGAIVGTVSTCKSLVLLVFDVATAASLSWEAFEQYSLWQILRAEIGGRAALIEKFAPGFLANVDPESAL